MKKKFKKIGLILSSLLFIFLLYQNFMTFAEIKENNGNDHKSGNFSVPFIQFKKSTYSPLAHYRAEAHKQEEKIIDIYDNSYLLDGQQHPTDQWNNYKQFLNTTEKVIKKENKEESILIRFPQFTDEFKVVNRLIKNQIIKELKCSRAERKEYEEECKEFLKENFITFTFHTEYKIEQKDNRFVSIIFAYYIFMYSGAHGTKSTTTFNYDLKNQRLLEINDFVKSESQMKTLEKICNFKLTHRLELYDNFNLFTFNKNKLFIHFDRCYAVGRESVAVDFKDLKK